MATSKNNQMLAANVRSLALTQIFAVLQDETPENAQFRKDLLLKLSTSLLPRLNEITGADGGAIMILPAALINKNDTPQNTGDSGPGQTPI